MDSLPLQDLSDYPKVNKAVLQTLNLNPEAYRKWLREIEFGADYQPRLIAQRIKNACLKWLCPLKHTAKEVAKDVCAEHYVALLPYKPKHCVTCHQPRTLKDAVLLMEVYMSAEAGVPQKETGGEGRTEQGGMKGDPSPLSSGFFRQRFTTTRTSFGAATPV